MLPWETPTAGGMVHGSEHSRLETQLPGSQANALTRQQAGLDSQGEAQGVCREACVFTWETNEG
jgi:hypothetical protein